MVISLKSRNLDSSSPLGLSNYSNLKYMPILIGQKYTDTTSHKRNNVDISNSRAQQQPIASWPDASVNLAVAAAYFLGSPTVSTRYTAVWIGRGEATCLPLRATSNKHSISPSAEHCCIVWLYYIPCQGVQSAPKV